MTYSFPCTDLSVAGKMQGMSKAEWEQGKSTRSGLLWEVERILKELPADELPQVLLMENVPQVHAEQNRADFEAWLAFLRSRGYFNFYQDLNAKDYGIPQNRDRCFCVSILSPEFIDYEFPEGVKLEKVMKDFLEEQVDEKYYINSEKADKLIAGLIERGELPTEQRPRLTVCVKNMIDKTAEVSAVQQDIAVTLMSRDYKGMNNYGCNGVIEKMVTEKKLGNLYGYTGGNFAGNVYEKEGLCPSILTMQGGGKQPMITEEIIEIKQATKDAVSTRGANIVSTIRASYHKNGERNLIENIETGKGYEGVIEIKQAIKEGSIKCKVGGCFDASFPDSKTRRGRVQNDGDVVPTLTASSSENINFVETQYRIRKLTPRECWRLMGYTDTDFDRASQVNSNTQLYKQAGNAIVKQVLMAIFAQMLPKADSKAISA
jgi:DNA (cytosine-5)-methyltransferase 1